MGIHCPGVCLGLTPVMIFSVTSILVAEMGITTGEVAGMLSPDIATLPMAHLPCLASNRVS